MSPESKSRAVFLDRDGVLNKAIIRNGKPFPPSNWEELELIPGVESGCHKLKAAGFLLVVVTNQPDVGRGSQTLEVVEEIHKKMCELLPVDRVEVSYDSGEFPAPRRKPQPGMILDAAKALDIDVRTSFLVGDRWRDIDAGKTAGCAASIFIDYGYEESLSSEPDYCVKNLAEAADLILRLQIE